MPTNDAAISCLFMLMPQLFESLCSPLFSGEVTLTMRSHEGVIQMIIGDVQDEQRVQALEVFSLENHRRESEG